METHGACVFRPTFPNPNPTPVLPCPSAVQVVYTEVVSNPTLRVADLSALADLAHGTGAQLVVDNTFTPFVVTPSRFGADVVIHRCDGSPWSGPVVRRGL